MRKPYDHHDTMMFPKERMRPELHLNTLHKKCPLPRNKRPRLENQAPCRKTALATHRCLASGLAHHESASSVAARRGQRRKTPLATHLCLTSGHHKKMRRFCNLFECSLALKCQRSPITSRGSFEQANKQKSTLCAARLVLQNCRLCVSATTADRGHGIRRKRLIAMAIENFGPHRRPVTRIQRLCRHRE